MRPQIPLLLARNTSVSFYPSQALASGGSTGQFLVKNSNVNFDYKFVTLITSMITDLVASATELNYSKGVTSPIQTQIATINTAITNLTNLLNNYLLLTGGTMSGPIAMGGNKITGLASGTNANDAVNKNQLDSAVVGLWDDRGSFDASGGSYPSSGGSGTAGAILKGDIWTISVGGTLPTGQVVVIGDTVRALIDTPGNNQSNWSILQNNIGYVPVNKAGDAMLGPLAMSNNKITGLTSGSATGDAIRWNQLFSEGTSSLLKFGDVSGSLSVIDAQIGVSRVSYICNEGTIFHINTLFQSEQTVANPSSIQVVEGYVKCSHTGIVALAIGTIGNFELSSNGTVTEARSVDAGGIVTGSGTLTNWYLYWAGIGPVSGTVVNGYGFYFGTWPSGVTNKYGIVINDSTAKNGFGVGTTPTSIVDVGPSTTSFASLRIRSGTAPTSPNDGDIWYDGTNLKMRIGGSTKTFTLT